MVVRTAKHRDFARFKFMAEYSSRTEPTQHSVENGAPCLELGGSSTALGVCAAGRKPRVEWFRSLLASLLFVGFHWFHAGIV